MTLCENKTNLTVSITAIVCLLCYLVYTLVIKDTSWTHKYVACLHGVSEKPKKAFNCENIDLLSFNLTLVKNNREFKNKRNTPMSNRNGKGTKKMIVSKKQSVIRQCQVMKYATPPLPVTALASFPGSGNTWLRHLLQEATGLWTGSIYEDKIDVKAFKGNKVMDGRAVVVKTHADPNDQLIAGQVILLIRNPFEALLSEFNRFYAEDQIHCKVGYADTRLFNSSVWDDYVVKQCERWHHVNYQWLVSRKPLLVVLYKDLKDNLLMQMKRIVKFLGIQVHKEHFNCMLNNSAGLYHRKARPIGFDIFSRQQVCHIYTYIDNMNRYLQPLNITVDSTVPN